MGFKTNLTTLSWKIQLNPKAELLIFLNLSVEDKKNYLKKILKIPKKHKINKKERQHMT